MIESAGIDTTFHRFIILCLRGESIVSLKEKIAGFDIFFFCEIFLCLFHQFIGTVL